MPKYHVITHQPTVRWYEVEADSVDHLHDLLDGGKLPEPAEEQTNAEEIISWHEAVVKDA